MKLFIFFGICIIGIIVDATPLKWHDTVKIHQKKDAKDASKEGKVADIYEVNEEHHLLEKGDHVGQGDILFKEGEEEAWFGDDKSGGNVKRDGIRNTNARWPNGVVPYVIAQANSAARSAIAAAAAEYKAKTCIKLVPRTNQRDYIRIIAGGGCYSYVGKTGGSQDLSLGRGCEYKSTAIHEFMHALGFFHEQSRTDRDTYITILFQNIQQRFHDQFQKQSANTVTTFGQRYDLDSVMHYDKTAFSSNGRQTIQAKGNPNRKLGQPSNGGLSDIDAKQLNAMYQCSNGGGGGDGGGGGGGGGSDCVKDKQSSCPTWAKAGFCTTSKYKTYMATNCCKSCADGNGGDGGDGGDGGGGGGGGGGSSGETAASCLKKMASCANTLNKCRAVFSN